MRIELNHLALIVGSIILIILVALCLQKDIRLCLVKGGVIVIQCLYFKVCKVEQSESVMDGHPSTIKHPP